MLSYIPVEPTYLYPSSFLKWFFCGSFFVLHFSFFSVLEMQKSGAQNIRLHFFTGLSLLGAVASDTGHLFYFCSLFFSGGQKRQFSKFWIYEIYGNKMNSPKEKLEKERCAQNSLHLASNSFFTHFFSH